MTKHSGPERGEGTRVPFGVRNGRMTDATTLQRNPLAEAACPECGQALEVRKTLLGPELVHRRGPPCPQGAATALELAARQAIADSGRLWVPECVYTLTAVDLGQGRHQASRALAARTLHFSSVALEQPLGGQTPGIVARVGAEPLLIEPMAVRQPEREAALTALALPLLVVEVGQATPSTLAEFSERVVYGRADKRWLVPLADPETRSEVQAELDRELATANAPYHEAARRAALETEQRALRAAKYRARPAAEKLAAALHQLQLTEAELPTFLNHPVSGEAAFGVPRHIWQAAVFAAFVNNKFQRFAEPYPFSADRVIAWLHDRFTVVPPFRNAEAVAVWKYLKHLETQGYLTYLKNRRFQVRHDSPHTAPAPQEATPTLLVAEAVAPVPTAPEAPLQVPAEPETTAVLTTAADLAAATTANDTALLVAEPGPAQAQPATPAENAPTPVPALTAPEAPVPSSCPGESETGLKIPVTPAPQQLWAWCETEPGPMHVESALSQVYWEADDPAAFVAIAQEAPAKRQVLLPVDAVAAWAAAHQLSEDAVWQFLAHAGFVEPSSPAFFAA